MIDKYEYLCVLNMGMVKKILGKRDSHGHKGTFGTLFCLCGSKEMSGAAIMSILAALRCGVGIVKSGIPTSIHDIVAKALPEPVFTLLEENIYGTVSKISLNTILNSVEKCTAVLLGCGLGRNNDVDQVVHGTLNASNIPNIPLVIDADGINSVAKNINVLYKAKSRAIITPHIGEMAKLFGVSSKEIVSGGAKYAKILSLKYGIVTVLKGSETIISNEEGKLFALRKPNSGMAKGGSGDVLSGMIASFLAQGLSPLDSALCGVYLHSVAGDICKKRYSETSMLPTDIINELPNIFLKMDR